MFTKRKAVVAIVAGLATTGSASATEEVSSQPVRLEVAESGGVVTLMVIGAADVATEARFTLKVSSRGKGGVNETTQGGQLRIPAGQEVTGAKVAVSVDRMAGWTAALNVTPTDGEAYTIERKSAAI